MRERRGVPVPRLRRALCGVDFAIYPDLARVFVRQPITVA
jgi:hypothetical protein